MKLYDMKDPYNLDYARTRLIGTIVRLEGRAVFIEDIGGKTAYFHYLTDEVRKQSACNLTDLDITPVELGYINFNTDVYYITRMPMRRDWRQGLRALSCTTPTNRRIDIPNNVLGKAIENIYPKFEEAIEWIGKGYKAAAFSRNFALSSKGTIQYKERFNVGVVDGNNYLLEPKYEWVREALEEELTA